MDEIIKEKSDFLKEKIKKHRFSAFLLYILPHLR